jgi:xanthine dehydrogenase YagR molybdenum-binding subunit
MAVEYNWPAKDKAALIGGRQDRIDGLAKATGAAKYTYDINLDRMLIAKALGSPHAHCRIKSIDPGPAEKTPGVVHVHVLRKPDTEIQWQGELIAIVAAESEGAAREGVANLKVEYEVLDAFTRDDDVEAAKTAGRTGRGGSKVKLEKEPGKDQKESEFTDSELKRLFDKFEHKVEGYYGIDAITHCCLEPHGSTCAWDGNKLKAYLSTQNVSGTDEQFAGALKVAPGDVEVVCEYIGGGFGSKFAADYWGIACAEIAKATGRPVQFMLDRDQELKLGGSRPSGYIKVKLAADEDGIVHAWDSEHWGTNGFTGGAVSQSVIPYIYAPKNYRRQQTDIKTNLAPGRAWRAPNHPQGCAITQTAFDDLAAKMGADSLEIFKKNLINIASNQKAEVYREEMDIAAKLMDWKAKWHPHGKGPAKGSVVEGLGLGLHTWGGAAHASNCMLRIHPDGTAESFIGTQDLGTGTRTVCAMVLAETLGLPVDAVRVNVGRSSYPASGPSGGSTTVGGVTGSHRKAAQEALARLFELVAPKLDAKPEDLEAAGGAIRVKSKADKSIPWKQACSMIGMKPLEITARHNGGDRGQKLTGSGVGGVQMAHVAVDKETGVVKMKKFVAVQDMGLVINRKLAESQIYGSVIMGIAYALFEQRITDPASGAFLNAEMSTYRLPRLGDIGEIVIEIYEPESERARGVIGLGEPPVIAPGGAISNAVCNALGVRVPVLPLTPKRVLDALAKK